MLPRPCWPRPVGVPQEGLRKQLPAEKQDAYFELVLYQVKATANLYALRQAEFTNILYAQQGRAAANDLATKAEEYFAIDQELMEHFNTEIADGIWHNFMLQPHIGYGDTERYGSNAGWQQSGLNNVALPDEIFPAVQRIELPETAEMGVAIDGSDQTWPDSTEEAVLPTFSPYQSQPTQYLDVFNRGSVPFSYRIEAGAPWIHVTVAEGTVDPQVRAEVRVDWEEAPSGTTTVPIVVTGADGQGVTVQAVVDNPSVDPGELGGSVEANGYVSMEAADFARAVNTNGITWTTIPKLGRTEAGVEPFPVTADSQEPGGDSPRLEYTMTTFSSGPAKVNVYLSPRADVFAQGGLRYAVSIDDGEPQVVNIQQANGANANTMNRQWGRTTSDNVNLTTTVHDNLGPGVHSVKIWMVDPIVVVQKVVVDLGGEKPSYLGPPKSMQIEPQQADRLQV